MILMKTIYKIIFEIGYVWYLITGSTLKYSYIAMRKLFYLTEGSNNKVKSERISKKQVNQYKFDIKKKEELVKLDHEDIDSVVNKVNEAGFYIFKNKVDSKVVEDLVSFSEKTKAKLMPYKSEKYVLYDAENPLAVKYQYQENDLMSSDVVQRIVTEEILLKIAQQFLKSNPILDLVSMWRSTSINKDANAKIAQLYHYDMDRLKFLKFFIYLSDVDTDNGPHCYVKGSNSKISIDLASDGRYTDEEIEKIYGKENMLELCAEKGTLMVVDTSGIHKGKLLNKNDRLIFQIEFTNSLFGQNNDKILIKNENETFQKLRSKYKDVYQRYYN